MSHRPKTIVGEWFYGYLERIRQQLSKVCWLNETTPKISYLEVESRSYVWLAVQSSDCFGRRQLPTAQLLRSSTSFLRLTMPNSEISSILRDEGGDKWCKPSQEETDRCDPRSRYVLLVNRFQILLEVLHQFMEDIHLLRNRFIV